MTDYTWLVSPIIAIGGMLAIAALIWAIKYKPEPLCDHNFVPMDTIRVQEPGEPVLAIIYLHHCAKCGTMKKTRVSNHGN